MGGLLRAGASSSSIAFSSMESEPAVEKLPRRPPKTKGEVCVGEVPDKPSVVIDMRRRWSCAAEAMVPGKGAVGPPEVLLERAKRLLKVVEVIEPRRGRLAPSFGGLLLLPLALDIVDDEGRVRLCVWRCANYGNVEERFFKDPWLLSSALGL